MKKLSVLFALLAVALFAKGYEPEVTFVVEPMTITPGGETTLTIKVSEPLSIYDEDEEDNVGYSAYQFDLYLPDGIFVDPGTSTKNPYKHRVDGEWLFMYETPINLAKHVTDVNMQSDGGLRFVTYHGSNLCFKNAEDGVADPTVLMILTVKANEDVVAGTYEASIKNAVFATGGDGTGSNLSGWKPEAFNFDVTVAGASQTEITLKITDAQYSTLILPFDADLPEGLKASTVEWPETGNELVETEVTDGKLLAGVPYLMFGEEVKTYTFTGVPTYAEETGTAGAMVGVLAESTVPAGCYVLQKQDGKVAFYKVTKERAFHANRCYLIAKPNGANMYRIGGTTGIDEVTVEEAGDVYDMLGRKVIGPLEKGVYIKNNRKIYVK